MIVSISWFPWLRALSFQSLPHLYITDSSGCFASSSVFYKTFVIIFKAYWVSSVIHFVVLNYFCKYTFLKYTFAGSKVPGIWTWTYLVGAHNLNHYNTIWSNLKYHWMKNFTYYWLHQFLSKHDRVFTMYVPTIRESTGET